MASWDGTSVDDNVIFSALNLVFLGYICLLFLPSWKHTQHITLALAVVYSVLYTVLLFHRFAVAPLPEGGNFSTLDGVVAFFTDRSVVLAGWTHYIAFDLMMARHIVLDSQLCEIPHLAICWTIPLTLMAGPTGLASYYATKLLVQKLLKQDRVVIADRVLQVLYCGATFCALFMVFWILVLPASWRIGNTPGYEEQVKKFTSEAVKAGTDFVPPSLLLKYSGHRAIQFMHTLPGALWATAVPLQLHPGFRKNHRVAHRRTGYAFFLASFSMMVGYALIDHRKLDFMRNDFPSVPYHESTSRLGLGWVPHLEAFRVVGLAFLSFAGLALRAILKRDFASHRKWVLRHIGWGLWIAPQRMYVGIMQGRTPEDQKANFADGTFVGLAITAVSAELAIWIYAQNFAPATLAKPVETASAEVQLVPKSED